MVTSGNREGESVGNGVGKGGVVHAPITSRLLVRYDTHYNGVHIKISLLVSSEVVEGLCVCQHHFYTPIFHSNTERAPFYKQTK